MEKIIKIDNKEYKMKSSAFTQFAYKNETGRSFLTDIQGLTKFVDTEINVDQLDEITEPLLRIAYVMIKEADSSQVSDYESFLKGIESLYDNVDWITEVILLGCTPISRQLQIN